MEAFTNFPLTILLAAASAVVWTFGNRRQEKRLILVGVLLSLAAIVTFLTGH